MNALRNSKVKNLYDTHISDRYEDDYELHRWFASSRLRADYFMNYLAIKDHVKDVSYNSCLELGPGPGTWTRVLYKHNSKATYTLVDISEAMRDQFRLEMREVHNVDYLISDFMNVPESEKVDFFFSSRAVEYLEDKDLFFEKLSRHVSDGGSGIIVTKNKDFGMFKLGSDTRFQHQGQLSADECRSHLESVGFKNIKIFPVIIRTPFFDRLTTRVSEIIFRKNYKKEINSKLMSKLTESYLVKFEK